MQSCFAELKAKSEKQWLVVSGWEGPAPAGTIMGGSRSCRNGDQSHPAGRHIMDYFPWAALPMVADPRLRKSRPAGGIPWGGTHGGVMPPLRGSIWCVTLPWVSLCSTHGCVMSPLCGSMWLPCNNYALCIMNYALTS